VSHPEFHVGEQCRGALGLFEGHEGIGVTMPPADRDRHVREGEPPRLSQQHHVVNHGLELSPGPTDQIVDEHGLEFPI
jgi:hypothetical protein